MNSIFNAAMRRAARLTSRQNLLEATRVIQDALSAKNPAGDSHAGNEARSPDESPSNEQLRQKEPGAFAAPWKELGLDDDDLPSPIGGGRMARPIGEVLELLRYGAPRFGFGARQAPVAPEVKTPEGAQFLSRSFTCEAGTRDYKLYIPSGAEGRKLPLVVMLHGCAQNPDDFAIGTGMNQLADEQGFIVAYPEQSSAANQSACWNWFSLKDQARDSGEPGIIAGIARGVIAEFGLDADRVCVAGLSAGGAMAAIMAAAYPDLFTAVGIHSGLPHGAANDVASAFAAMRSGARPDATIEAQPGAGVRTIVFHGASDRTVHPANAELIVAAARARLDNAVEETQDGKSAGASYVRRVIKDANGAAQIEYWAIDGLGHAWSGGNPDGSYTRQEGPDASREMVRFFLESAERIRRP